MSNIILNPGQIISRLRSLPSIFLGKNKTPAKISAQPQDNTGPVFSSRPRTRVNILGSKCKKTGQHLWRFQSFHSILPKGGSALVAGGWFICARCGRDAVLRTKRKPHNDKINFRRSDPRHLQFAKFNPPAIEMDEAA